jgi:hypothetical protein
MRQTYRDTVVLDDGEAAAPSAAVRRAGESCGWKEAFVADLDRTAARDRWGRVLQVIAWVHLAMFLVCQWLYDPKVESDPRMLWLWLFDLAAAWVALRVLSGRSWYPGNAAAGVVLRVWVTFLIVSFSAVLFNVQTGWAIHWYRLSWLSLGTFGFAMLGWLVDLRFLLLAVQMWATGMLVVRLGDWAYVIYGLSWWTALQIVGAWLERRRLSVLRGGASLARG